MYSVIKNPKGGCHSGMSFFDSEIVRAEMTEIHELQEDVYENFMRFPYMNNADRAHHIDQLSKLIEKQKIVYARLSLSDDPDAKRNERKKLWSLLNLWVFLPTLMSVKCLIKCLK